MEDYFQGDSYYTPVGHPRPLGYRLCFGSRWYMYTRFIYSVLKYRRYAVNGFYDDAKWAASSYAIFRAVEDSGGDFRITGIDHIRKDTGKPVVFISNHMSTLETVVFPSLIVPIRPVTFVVKDVLVKSKIFGPVMRSRHPIVVGRTNPREDLQIVLRQGKEILEDGRSIIIFPQSTRQDEFDPKQFNSLGVKLAARAGARVIPVAIKTDFWGNGKWMKEFGPLHPEKPIHIAFGEPMTVSGNGREEHQKIVNYIQSHLDEWK